MKKIFFISWLFISNVLNGQSDIPDDPITDTINVNSYAEAIDLTFGLIPPSHYNSSFLIEKSGYHYTFNYADGRQNDSIFNMVNWYFFYEKFYYSQLKDTLIYHFIQLDSIKDNYIANNDVLPFGVLDFDYYKFRDSAIIDGSIIANNHRFVENTTDFSKIFKKSKLFCVSPLNTEVNTLNPQFVLLPNLIFSNNQVPLDKIIIDCDDNMGFKEVYINQNFQGSYSFGGYKNIVTKFIYVNGDTLVSNSQLYVIEPDPISRFAASTSQSYNFAIDVLSWSDTFPFELGLPYTFKKATFAVWQGCGNNVPNTIRKPVILFSGYNPKNGKDLVDNGNAKWINDLAGPLMALAGWRGPLFETYNGFYTDASKGAPGHSYGSNGSEFLNKLIAEGYDIVIVKMDDGVGLLQYNAHMVTQVIKKINELKQSPLAPLNPGASLDPEAPGFPNTNVVSRPHHENIVVGYSAGGLGTRMGLLLMEYQHKQYMNTSDSWKFPHHNTKTWIGYDCENQGSNTPIGFQMMLDFLNSSYTAPISLGDLLHTIVANKALQLIKDHGVATQNTLYHIQNLTYCGGNVFCIDHHSDYSGYFQDLENLSPNNPTNLKGYPLNVRRIAVSPGSANGITNTISGNDMLHYEAMSNPCFTPMGGAFNVNPLINPFSTSPIQIRGFRRAQSYFITQPGTQPALDCKIGVSIKTIFWSWHINYPHNKYKNGNYINNAKEYDVTAGSILPTHVIFGSKLPFASTSIPAAAFFYCVYGPYNGKLHGFCPTSSALDIHESWNTSLLRQPNFNLTPASQNLLFQNDYIATNNSQPPHHNFGYPHIKHPNDHYDITPFDAVCANGDFDPTYYYDNTIHIEDPNPYVAEFLVEEIAPATLYLSNRTIHDETTGEKYYADFEARNSVLVGNQDIYRHDANPNNWYPRLQSSPGDFIIDDNAVVTIRASNKDGQSAVTLGAGFSSKHGSIFRAYIYDEYCDAFSYRSSGNRMANNSTAPEQPAPRSFIAKRATSNKLKENIAKINVVNYPNPTTGSIFYELKNEDTYLYTVSDLTGRVLETGTITNANNQLNLSNFKAGIYLITIKNSNYSQTDRIVLQ